ncbi:hypothetical protein R83H12_02679 [Fibrobacteria bacterium R8-3-H12]
MPPLSWARPGIKPGTSTKFTTGMLKALQKRMNLAPLSELSISKQPAFTAGWFAIMPITMPSILAKPTTMFFAKSF